MRTIRLRWRGVERAVNVPHNPPDPRHIFDAYTFLHAMSRPMLSRSLSPSRARACNKGLGALRGLGPFLRLCHLGVQRCGNMPTLFEVAAAAPHA